MAAYAISLTEDDLFAVLMPWLAAVTGLTVGTTIIQGIPNRDAMPPPAPGYISATMVRSDRLWLSPSETWDPTDPDPSAVEREQHWRVTVQLDIYGANAMNWKAAIATLWTSSAACVAMAGVDGMGNPNPEDAGVCQPLSFDTPIMDPLESSEGQYEKHWILPLTLQYNPVVSVPQDFMSEAVVTLINVDQAYKP